MKKVFKKINLILEKCKECDNLYPDKGFGRAYNNAIITKELLFYYYEVVWKVRSKNVSLKNIDKIRQENSERIMMVFRNFFISTFSAIEYSIRENVKSKPNSKIFHNCFYNNKGKKRRSKDIKLYDLVDNFELGRNTFRRWKYLMKLRNCTVHNNSIAQENYSITINNCEYKIQKNKMLKGSLLYFADMTMILLDLYSCVIKKGII